MLRASRTQAVNQGFDDVGAAISTQSLRSGASGAGAAAQLAKARSQALAQTMGVPELEGLQAAEDLNATKRGNAINNYNAIASRASSGGSFGAPGSVAPALNQPLQSLRSGGQQGLQGAAGTTANAGRPIQQPGVYNPAPLIASFGNAAADLYSSIYSSRTGGSNPINDRNVKSNSGEDLYL
jgi:hypothetical protein